MQINQITFSGFLGQDPKISKTQSGYTVMNFSIAQNYYNRNKDKFTTWLDITAFGKTAELVEDKIKKGSAVCVAGQIRNKTDNNNQTKTYLLANFIMPIDTNRGSKLQEEYNQGGIEIKQQGDTYPKQDPLPDDELPF